MSSDQASTIRRARARREGAEITERRLTHEDDPVLARHVSNRLISGPSGLPPDLDVAECQPIAAALGAMIAYDGVVRIGPAPEPMVILPSLA